MATSRITCPDCKSGLKPAKPVPDGKKIKCPKCGNIFTTPGLVVDEEQRPRKPAPAQKAKAAIKKAAAPKPPPPKPIDDDDDDDSGGVYGYIDDSAPKGDGDEEEDDKPKIDYSQDSTIKDLRGPAQAALVKPSNYLLLIGGICCLLDILIICVSFWPMVFSEYLIDHENFLADYYKQARPKKNNDDDIQSNPLTGGGAAPVEQKPGTRNIPDKREKLDKEDLDLVLKAEAWAFQWPYVGRYYRFMAIGAFIALFLYNATAIMGAVKMQNMESRRWGIASSIMTMLPFGAASICLSVAFIFYLLFAMLLDDESMGWTYAGGTASLVWVLAIVAGAYGLRILMSQDVIDGFEYVAE